MDDFSYKLKKTEIGVLLLKKSLEIAAVSTSAASLLGLAEKELLGRNLWAHHDAEARAKIELLVAQLQDRQDHVASLMVPIPGRVLHVRLCLMQGQEGEEEQIIAVLHAVPPTESPAQSEDILYLRKIPAEKGDKTEFIDAEEVSYIAAEGHYTYLHSSSDVFFCSLSLSELERRLDPKYFIRPHRSYLVNLNVITAFYRRHNGGVLVLAGPDAQEIPVSRSRISNLRQRLAI